MTKRNHVVRATKELGMFSSEIFCTIRQFDGSDVTTVDYIGHSRLFGVLCTLLDVDAVGRALIRVQDFQESKTLVVHQNDVQEDHE